MLSDATDDCCNANHAAKPKRPLVARRTTAQACVRLHHSKSARKGAIRKGRRNFSLNNASGTRSREDRAQATIQITVAIRPDLVAL